MYEDDEKKKDKNNKDGEMDVRKFKKKSEKLQNGPREPNASI